MALYRVLEAFKPRFRVPVLAMPGTSVPGLPGGQGASEPKEGPDDTESIGTKNSSKMELGHLLPCCVRLIRAHLHWIM